MNLAVTPTIHPTEADLEAGKLVGNALASAVMSLEEDGFLVLDGVIPAAEVECVRERMLADLPRFLARADAPFNWHAGNLQQAPPRDRAALFPSILLNPFACSVSRAMLGEQAINTHYTANTALPRSACRQPVHADYGHLWPALLPVAPPHGLILNIPLIDMDASTGSVELWPGSHRSVTIRDGASELAIPSELVEARRRHAPPVQPSVRAGSILIRDLRLWHAGMPNPSERARPMLAMIHFAPWWGSLEVMDFPASTKPLFDGGVLRTSVRFVSEDINHVALGRAHGFQG